MAITMHGDEIHIVGLHNGKRYTLERPYVIDLVPVNKFISSLESMVDSEQARRERRLPSGTAQLMDLAESMNSDQMRYVVSGLLSQVQLWSQLYQAALNDPEGFASTVDSYRQIHSASKEVSDGAYELLERYRSIAQNPQKRE